MDLRLIHQAIDQFDQSWLALSAAGPVNFRRRDWKAQRLAMARRVALGDATVRVLQRACQTPDHWLENWPAIVGAVAKRAGSLPAPLHQALLFALSQAVLPEPDHGILEACDAPRKSLATFRTQRCTGTHLTIAAHLVEHLAQAVVLDRSRDDYAFIAQRLAEEFPSATQLHIEGIPQLFYRNQHAYYVAELRADASQPPLPCCLTLRHHPTAGHVMVDAVLTGEANLMRLMEFSRSPFLLDVPDPSGLLAFLSRLLPQKDLPQLAMNLGFTHLGEAILVHHFRRHLQHSTALLTHTPGTPGMVMLTMCLHDFPVVFKIARNKPHPPKTITRQEVMERYAFVSRQDRVGRMADAHRYAAWCFPRERFAPELLHEIQREASHVMRHVGHNVVLLDVITERKLIPLDIYLRTAPPQELHHAVIDYGRAIKEMAMSNIFPGDFLHKNFGVTPFGRVVFYDYDEVCALTECNFRAIPQPRTPEEEMAAEPWYSIGPHDVFPEEFAPFITPHGEAATTFRSHHADLFTPAFWQHWQQFHATGTLLDLQPYESQRPI